jgi:hypothetical protein
MALLGKGALVIWHDPAPEIESDYNEWHSKEHMSERVGYPGSSVAARRRDHRRKCLNRDEVDDFATLWHPATQGRWASRR